MNIENNIQFTSILVETNTFNTFCFYIKIIVTLFLLYRLFLSLHLMFFKRSEQGLNTNVFSYIYFNYSIIILIMAFCLIEVTLNTYYTFLHCADYGGYINGNLNMRNVMPKELINYFMKPPIHTSYLIFAFTLINTILLLIMAIKKNRKRTIETIMQ